MKWMISLILLLLSHAVVAEPEHWMKQADPNSLGLFVWVSNSCPFDEEGLVNRIEGEFLRARLKPTKSLKFNLTINVNCMSVKNKNGSLMGNVANVEVRYGAKMPSGENVLYETPDHGGMIVGNNDAESKQYFMTTIADYVALSLTDYLKANFQ